MSQILSGNQFLTHLTSHLIIQSPFSPSSLFVSSSLPAFNVPADEMREIDALLPSSCSLTPASHVTTACSLVLLSLPISNIIILGYETRGGSDMNYFPRGKREDEPAEEEMCR